ncbi:MAG TPA: NfeD family protein [Candidatus Sumerlaeota bacterium]|nr:NfeD family protein [Candidatus Sumerlaeota bacterium]
MTVFQAWHLWVIAGIILLILEVFTPGFVMVVFGLGCFVTALFAGYDCSVTLQLVVFVVACATLMFSIRPLVLKTLQRNTPKYNTNADALIGQTGCVIEAIHPASRTGRVKIGGEDWRAVTVDESDIEAGQKVLIKGIDGNKVVVELCGGENNSPSRK